MRYMPRAEWPEKTEWTEWTGKEVFRDPGFPLGISHAYPQTSAEGELHRHVDFDELAVVYRGEAVHYSADEEYVVRAGDVFVIKGRQQHGYRDTDGLCLYNICFDPRRILINTVHAKKLPGYHVLFSLEPKYRRAHRFDSRLQLTPDQLEHVIVHVAELARELERAENGYEYIAMAIFMQIIGMLCRCFADTTNHNSRSLMRIAGVISYIEHHYPESIELEKLAASAHLSSGVLLKVFKEATGLSPIDYLIRLRIARACDLFRSGQDMTITEIAFNVGFSDSNYFTRQFKRVMGTTPSVYRKRVATP